jgi:hypothetical protein
MMKFIASDGFLLTSLALAAFAYVVAKLSWTKHEGQQIFKDRNLFAQFGIDAERPTVWATIGNKSMLLAKTSCVWTAISAVLHLVDYIKS